MDNAEKYTEEKSTTNNHYEQSGIHPPSWFFVCIHTARLHKTYHFKFAIFN